MSCVDFLKNNDNIKEGINENFFNIILKSYNPHLLCIYGKPRMGKSTLLNQLLSGFQENNQEEENDNNYFLLDEPFKVGHGEGNFTTKGCNIFGKIKLSELLKRNCCNNFNHMKDADLFIVDTEGLNSLGGNTSACISGILTLLQVSTIKIYFIGDIETKDVVNAEQLIKLSDVVNYKSQNYSSQKIFLLKKNASIDRRIKKKK
jgi:GTPase SAR1 family protein